MAGTGARASSESCPGLLLGVPESVMLFRAGRIQPREYLHRLSPRSRVPAPANLPLSFLQVRCHQETANISCNARKYLLKLFHRITGKKAGVCRAGSTIFGSSSYRKIILIFLLIYLVMNKLH